jgi:hypothetical protein
VPLGIEKPLAVEVSIGTIGHFWVGSLRARLIDQPFGPFNLQRVERLFCFVQLLDQGDAKFLRAIEVGIQTPGATCSEASHKKPSEKRSQGLRTAKALSPTRLLSRASDGRNCDELERVISVAFTQNTAEAAMSRQLLRSLQMTL